MRIKNRCNPWFSQEIAELLHARDTAWNKARASGSISDWKYFCHLRNKCLVSIRNAKSHYYVTSLSDCSGNPSKFWRTIKTLSNRLTSSLPTQISQGSIFISDKNEQCDLFNRHFIAAGDIFHTTSPVGNSNPTFANTSPHSFFFRPFTRSEVLSALCSLDPRKPTGADHLNTRLLILAAPFIVDILLHIFNLTLLTGCIPNIWKTAFVTPLHKSGPTNELNNYRPISKLPCLTKILERLISNQIRSFLSEFSVLKKQCVRNVQQVIIKSFHMSPETKESC